MKKFKVDYMPSVWAPNTDQPNKYVGTFTRDYFTAFATQEFLNKLDALANATEFYEADHWFRRVQ